MTVRDALLPALDVIRGIPGLMGLRRVAVALVTKTWPSGTTGIGAPSIASIPIVNANGTNPRVRQVPGSPSDWLVTCVTPSYTTPTAGGFSIQQLLPDQPTGERSFVRLTFEDGSTRDTRILALTYPKPFRFELYLTDEK